VGRPHDLPKGDGVPRRLEPPTPRSRTDSSTYDVSQGVESTSTEGGGTQRQETSQTPGGNAWGNAIDADEELLETKMLAADLAGNATLCNAYGRRLERLRAGNAPENVVGIESARLRARPSK
jgi:hypothetical protein